MRRREFIAGLGGAMAWPLTVWAQPAERVRRIGVLMGFDENDPTAKTRLSAFTQALADLGWTDGRNVRMDLRWGGGDTNRIRALAHELVGLQPDIILTNGTAATVAVQRETRTIPIVFTVVADPVAGGIVARLDRPGANITGFGVLQASLGGKWLQVLSEIAPGLKRAAIMFNPDTAPVSAYITSFETAARSLKVELIIAPVHSDVEIEMRLNDLGGEPGGGLVIMPDVFTFAHRPPIISAAARNNVPAVYGLSAFAREGGLLSYAIDTVDNWRRAAAYVDRILRGAKLTDLPVQFPPKFEMVVNLKTAKALGLDVPPSILLSADEVIERRREFIAGLGSTAAWPVVVRAQPAERVRRIGVLTSLNENDLEGKRRYSAFTQALAGLGWSDGRNVRMDVRWFGDDANGIRALARELVDLQPDVILTGGTPATFAIQRETRTIPIVFAGIADPVAQRIAARLDQPGGNITGFALYEASLGGKWLELLSEIAPGLKRAAILFNPDFPPATTFLLSFETAARSLKVEPIIAPVHSDVEIETAIIGLGREPGGGHVIMGDAFTAVHRVLIISAAARNNVPAVYNFSVFARDGGLLSYGADLVDPYRRAATYVDRILRGAKPGDLPVQLPTKFELVINLKTAKALGLTIPPNLLAVADEVIE